MLLTIVGMVLLANTPVAEFVGIIYSIPLIGMLVYGVLLSVGQYVAVTGVEDDRTGIAVIGASILVLSFSSLGAGILSPYSTNLYIDALLVTSLITTAITVLIGIYVFRTDKNLSHWRRYSMYSFGLALLTAGVGLVYAPIFLLTFIFILFGFVADYVYEIWNLNKKARSPVAAGVALYVAFAGIFIQILQLVLRLLAKDN